MTIIMTIWILMVGGLELQAYPSFEACMYAKAQIEQPNAVCVPRTVVR